MILCSQRSAFFQKLRSTVQKYLHMTLYLDVEASKSFAFYLKDVSGNRYDLIDLSSGDQSLLLIIFTIFGYDLQSGFLVIDEPELHLHPQMQKEFLAFVEDLAAEFSLQVILATHSPLMINEKNIHNVYRFNKQDLGTQIYHPKSLFHDEAELIHMLKFENIAKVFFVDKIIMVE